MKKQAKRKVKKPAKLNLSNIRAARLRAIVQELQEEIAGLREELSERILRSGTEYQNGVRDGQASSAGQIQSLIVQRDDLADKLVIAQKIITKQESRIGDRDAIERVAAILKSFRK